MKVKELIKKLQELDQEAHVVSREYTGGYHSIHDVIIIEQQNKDNRIDYWDGDSDSDFVDSLGICKENVVYIN